MAVSAMSDQMIGEVSQLFGALGDPSRLRIIRALIEAGEPLSQGTVSERAGLSQANSSKHLAFLVRVGIVLRSPDGNVVNYSIATPLVHEICDLVCGHVTTRIRAAFHAIQ